MAKKSLDDKIQTSMLRIITVFTAISVIAYIGWNVHTNGFDELGTHIILIPFYVFIFFFCYGLILTPFIAIAHCLIDAFKRPSDKENNAPPSPPQAVTDKPDNNNDNMFAWFLVFLMFLGIFWPSDDSNDDG